jgi:hypothetical protein
MASVTPVTSNVDDQDIINDDHDGGDHLGTDVDGHGDEQDGW